jgi:hypothetical protein
VLKKQRSGLVQNGSVLINYETANRGNLGGARNKQLKIILRPPLLALMLTVLEHNKQQTALSLATSRQHGGEPITHLLNNACQ